ncbi:hypothetical protein [Streptomyces adustus]|uniref:hypothetical protein n=1 Tax=Streptomyces adustus TaxID=1609272 RepID=UPI003713BC50
MIEQAQILTTHNLALLAGPVVVNPQSGLAALARSAFATTCRLATRIHGNPHPLRTTKDMAYAWRQALFYLSMATPDKQRTALAQFDDDAARCPDRARTRLAPVLAGLRFVHVGGDLGRDGGPTNNGARRLLGWAPGGRHWLQAKPAAQAVTHG